MLSIYGYDLPPLKNAMRRVGECAGGVILVGALLYHGDGDEFKGHPKPLDTRAVAAATSAASSSTVSLPCGPW